MVLPFQCGPGLVLASWGRHLTWFFCPVVATAQGPVVTGPPSRLEPGSAIF